MPEIDYTVACTFTDPAVAEDWAAWLRRRHLAEVVAAGARAARLVRLDGEALCYQACYRFASRADFERYQRDHGPRLRAEGLERFPLTLGLTYSRSVGEVLAEHP